MSELSSVVKQQNDFSESINFSGNKIDDFDKRMKSVEVLDKKLSSLDSQVSALNSVNKKIKSDINTLQQSMEMSKLEGIEVPESRNESVIQVVKDISAKINFESSDVLIGSVGAFPSQKD
ncbi:hypothetical protein HHI36_009792 [Cryptolaemus montrouzieri]|uniref:Uncharacterized protein n=1 Tax=Cryptolaemus montrouzieri TaxID=559131 RepID=A0ABD2MH95_9CUCU